MSIDRRSFLKGLGAIPLLGAAGSLEGLVRGKQAPLEYYLTLWLEGPFGVFVQSENVVVWTPYDAQHIYKVGSTMLPQGAAKHMLRFVQNLPQQDPLRVDKVFKNFALRGVAPPDSSKAYKIWWSLPRPSSIQVESCRSAEVNRSGAIKTEQMPVNFLLNYKVDQDQFDHPDRLAVTDGNFKIQPVLHSKRRHQLKIQAGLPMPHAKDDPHTMKIMAQLVSDTGSPASALTVQKILDDKHACTGANIQSSDEAQAKFFGTDVDCTAGGLPGCNPPSACG